MDLLKATPTNTAKFKFVVEGKPAKTDKGDEQFIEILGAHAKEFQSALLDKHHRTIEICKRLGTDGEDDKITPAAKKELDDNQMRFLCEITQSVLLDIGGKITNSAEDFYSNPELEYWVGEVDKFAGNTANFIKA